MTDTVTPVPAKTEATPAAATPPRPSPLEALRQEIDRVFDNFGFGRWRLPSPRTLFDFDLTVPPAFLSATSPAVDIVQKDAGYEITAELPGLDEKDIDLSVVDDTLTIKGEKKEDKTEQKKDYYITERRYGSFVRSFRLPEGADASKIEATFKKGVLTVVVPVSAETSRKETKIAVKAA